MLEKAAEISDVTLTEGSFVYNALAVVAMALEDAYTDAEAVMDNAMADTCDREHLIRFAKSKGLVPKPATKAQYALECNVELPTGFRLTDGTNDYTVLTAGTTPTAQIETEGSAGNDYTVGTELSAVDYVDGFETCVITGRVGIGEDEEDTEVFRQRYFDALDVSGMFGNEAFYKRMTQSVEGVEQVGVTYNNGIVKVGVLGPGNTFPSQDVRSAVFNLLYDSAPLGHMCQILNLGAAPYKQTEALKVTNITPASANTQINQALIQQIIEDYYFRLRDGFEKTRYIYHDRLVGYITTKLEETGADVTGLDVVKGNGQAFTSVEYQSFIIPVPEVTFEE